jgi:hypothetical protein
MKKLIAICIVAAFATSCKKEYSCECTSIDNSGSTPETTVDIFKASSNKKDAEAWCSSLEKSTADINGTVLPNTDATTCKLK